MGKKKDKLRVWLTGAGGQLGNAIMRNYADLEQIQWLPTIRTQVDLTCRKDTKRFFDIYKPDVILNAAAYTAVDSAELNKEDAEAMNSKLPGVLGEMSKNSGKILLHISTDHVFGGVHEAQPRPLKETDTPYPCNEYGLTKLKGEKAALEANPRSYILRTSWLYSPYGNNFYKKIRRMGLEDDVLRLVTDEVGSPTSALDLAATIVRMLELIRTDRDKIPFGLYHYADQGEVSRYEFAKKILELDPATTNIETKKVLQKDFETIAKRPLYSVLDTSKIEAALPGCTQPWDQSLQRVYEVDMAEESSMQA